MREGWREGGFFTERDNEGQRKSVCVCCGKEEGLVEGFVNSEQLVCM